MKKILSALLVIIIFVSTASATTLQVGSTTKYKTIQAAVNVAKTGDIIQVASGTYHETVILPPERITILGTKYPKVDGFELSRDGGETINGFSIQKYGIYDYYSGGNNVFRNNYFYNCGISIKGGASSFDTVMNNQIINGTIDLYDTKFQTIKGNTVYKSKIGLNIGESVSFIAVTKNIFKNCQIAVQTEGDLTSFYGNKYIRNKQNFKLVTI
jgi:hypothetical protein